MISTKSALKRAEARAPASVAKNELVLRSRQATRKIDLRFLRRVILHLLEELLYLEFEVGVTLIDSREMSRINECYLQHAGSTDVITFDYSDADASSLNAQNLLSSFKATGLESARPLPPHPSPLPKGEGGPRVASSAEVPGRVFGDIYVCVDEAVAQSKRFRASWQEEIVRYVVHGILHLLGHDDRKARSRKTMKRLENELVAELAARFPLRSLMRRTRRCT